MSLAQAGGLRAKPADFGAGFIEQLEDLSGGHHTYLREMRNRLERDAELAGWIREEIGAE